jgi:hypothetical protein
VVGQKQSLFLTGSGLVNWSFIVGLLVGGFIGAFTVALMIAASKADDLMGDRQYEENS